MQNKQIKTLGKLNDIVAILYTIILVFLTWMHFQTQGFDNWDWIFSTFFWWGMFQYIYRSGNRITNMYQKVLDDSYVLIKRGLNLSKESLMRSQKAKKERDEARIQSGRSSLQVGELRKEVAILKAANFLYEQSARKTIDESSQQISKTVAKKKTAKKKE